MATTTAVQCSAHIRTRTEREKEKNRKTGPTKGVQGRRHTTARSMDGMQSLHIYMHSRTWLTRNPLHEMPAPACRVAASSVSTHRWHHTRLRAYSQPHHNTHASPNVAPWNALLKAFLRRIAQWIGKGKLKESVTMGVMLTGAFVKGGCSHTAP